MNWPPRIYIPLCHFFFLLRSFCDTLQWNPELLFAEGCFQLLTSPWEKVDFRNQGSIRRFWTLRIFWRWEWVALFLSSTVKLTGVSTTIHFFKEWMANCFWDSLCVIMRFSLGKEVLVANELEVILSETLICEDAFEHMSTFLGTSQQQQKPTV